MTQPKWLHRHFLEVAEDLLNFSWFIIQCNMTEILLNRIPSNLENKLLDLHILKTFSSRLICGGGGG